jgi:hypothetical protein
MRKLDGTEAMSLLIKRACIGEILDFAVTLDAKGPPLIQLTLQSPVHQEFEAVDFHVLANLADKERIDRRRIWSTNYFGKGAELDLVRPAE